MGIRLTASQPANRAEIPKQRVAHAKQQGVVDMQRRIVLSGALVVTALLVAGGCDQQQHADVSGDSHSLRNTRDANRVGSDPPSGKPRADSSPAVAERVRVVTIPSGGIVPDAEVDRRGVIHLAY